MANEWKMPDNFPSGAKLRKDGRVDIWDGKRHIITSLRNAEMIEADLIVISKKIAIEDGALE